MRILFLSHTSEVGPFRVGSHHLSRGMARLGHTVVHASSPVSLAHWIRRRRDSETRQRLQAARKGVIGESPAYSTLIPFHFLPLSDRAPHLNFWSAQFPLVPWRRAVIRALGGSPDCILVDRAAMFPLTGFFPDARLITRATDLPRNTFEKKAFETAAQSSHAVVGTSLPVLEMLTSANSGVPHLLLENGVELDRFLSVTRPAWPDRHGAVYVGSLDSRFDWDWLRCVAQASPETRVDVWGPLNNVLAPGDLPDNCRLRGPIDYVKLPEVLVQYRVGLLPLVDSEANSGRSPMKLFEYLAASLRVISTPTVALSSFDCPDIWLFPSGERLSSGFRQAHSLPEPQDGILVSAKYSWESRTRILERFLHDIRIHSVD
jgi:teichuronic acid biosynthesis glycosyltransferase TuaH